MRLPPLKSLQVFLYAAEYQSFKIASEKLFVSQAAISQQVRLLEDYFDAPLFERHNKKTSLSIKGKLLFPYIKNAFDQISQGVNTLSHEPNVNELRVTALHSVTSLLLIPHIDKFQQLHPEISIQFTPNNLLNSFQGDDIDIAIRRGLGNYDGLESRKLIDDAIMLVASPLLFGANSKDIDTVFALPVLSDTSSDIQEAVTDCCHRFGVKESELKITLKTTDALPIIQTTLAGQGIAFISKALIKDNLKQGQLINVLEYVYHSPRTLYLVAPPHHFNWSKVKRFELWLKTLFSEKL